MTSAPAAEPSRPSRNVPTPSLIRAAECVFMAMAMRDHVRPIVHEYQQRILREGQWPLARQWSTPGESPRVILDPAESFLLEAADAALYFARCDEARKTAKLGVNRDGNCPLLEAEHLLVQAERELLEAVAELTGVSADKVSGLPREGYRQYIDLTLRFVASAVTLDPHKRFGIPKAAALE